MELNGGGGGGGLSYHTKIKLYALLPQRGIERARSNLDTYFPRGYAYQSPQTDIDHRHVIHASRRSVLACYHTALASLEFARSIASMVLHQSNHSPAPPPEASSSMFSSTSAGSLTLTNVMSSRSVLASR